MEEAYYYGKINLNIKVNGRKMNPMVKANMFFQMEIIIQEIGRKEKQMAKENLFI